jgi:G3E family GTPase
MPTPVYVISGFLGSGKTTFINNILESAPVNLKIMVLVNEFGAISIDREIIKADPGNIVDLSGGCICCGLFTELMASLLFALDTLKADIILIESTGLAFPQEIARQALTPAFEGRIEFGGIITLVEAKSMLSDDYPIIMKQLEAANVVILNKIDLIDSSTLAQAWKKIKPAIPAESISFEASFARINYKEIFFRRNNDRHINIKYSKTNLSQFDSTAGFATVSYVRNSPLSMEIIYKLFKTHGNKIIRSKGFLVTEKGNVQLQFSENGLEIKDIQKPIKRSELVLIVREENKKFVEEKFKKAFGKSVGEMR